MMHFDDVKIFIVAHNHMPPTFGRASTGGGGSRVLISYFQLVFRFHIRFPPFILIPFSVSASKRFIWMYFRIPNSAIECPMIPLSANVLKSDFHLKKSHIFAFLPSGTNPLKGGPKKLVIVFSDNQNSFDGNVGRN